MSTTISRSRAKQLTLVYQLAACGCVLGAVAVGVLGLPEPASVSASASVSQTPAIPGINANASDPAGQADRTQVAQVRIDPGSIAARLGMLDNAPKGSVEEPVGESGPVEIDTDSLVGMLSKRVRYTGYISEGDQPLAFLRIDGSQRIVPEGGVARAGSMGLDDLTVKIVRPKHIVVTDGIIEERIKLFEKTGPSVTISGGVDIVVVNVPQKESEVILSPEELEELSQYPARQRAMQERIMKRKKMGRPMPGVVKEPLASFKAGFGDRPEGGGSRRAPERPVND